MVLGFWMGGAKAQTEKGVLRFLFFLGGAGVKTEPRGDHNVMHAERCNVEISSYTATSRPVSL